MLKNRSGLPQRLPGVSAPERLPPRGRRPTARYRSRRTNLIKQWAATESDVQRSLEAMLAIAASESQAKRSSR